MEGSGQVLFLMAETAMEGTGLGFFFNGGKLSEISFFQCGNWLSLFFINRGRDLVEILLIEQKAMELTG